MALLDAFFAGLDPVSALAGGLAGALLAASVVGAIARASRVAAVARAEAGSAAAIALADERARALAERDAAIDQLRGETKRLGAAIIALERDRATLAQQLCDEQRGATEKLAMLDSAERRLHEAFSKTSLESLQQSGQQFLELAKLSFAELQQTASGDLDLRKQAIDALVSPLHESLARVDARMIEIEKARHEHYGSLTHQLTSVAMAHQKLETETRRLVDALRRPEARGRWGEIQLHRVVEMAEMVDHVDFVEQTTLAGEEGRLRPDMIVKLPGGQSVVVDAKAPLDAYLRAIEAPDDDARVAALRDHARQVRNHMTQLSAKAYFERLQPAPEFVVMFLPGEAFFAAALQHDPGLIEFGVARRVIPASPTTLIALLRAAYYGWRQERVAENAEIVSELGRELHERISKLASHFGVVGGALGRAVESYNAAMGSLESRVLVSARRFEALGAAKEGVAIDAPAMQDAVVRQLATSSGADEVG